MAVGNGGFGQIGVNRGCADTDQHCEIMRVETFGRTDIDRRVTAQSVAYQMRMYSSGGEYHRNTNPVCADILIGQEKFGFAHANCFDSFLTDPRNRRAQAFLTFGNVVGAVDFGGELTECRFQSHPFRRS